MVDKLSETLESLVLNNGLRTGITTDKKLIINIMPQTPISSIISNDVSYEILENFLVVHDVYCMEDFEVEPLKILELWFEFEEEIPHNLYLIKTKGEEKWKKIIL
ncbi:hypothetical protein ACEXAJ_04770 [Fusobacterium necrophorum subsp. funduliforme]